MKSSWLMLVWIYYHDHVDTLVGIILHLYAVIPSFMPSRTGLV